MEVIGALAEPVPVLIRSDFSQNLLQTGKASHLGKNRELLLLPLTVRSLRIVDTGRPRKRSILHQDQHRHTHTDIKNILAIPIPEITPQIIHVDVAELLGEGHPHPGSGVTIQPAPVGHISDDPAILDPQGGPLDRPNVGVVCGFLILRRGASYVGIADGFIQIRVPLILVVVVGGLLPDTPRRVAHDHLDIQLLQLLQALIVLHEHRLIQLVVLLPGLEGIREDQSREGLVFPRLVQCTAQILVRGLDVHRRDVIGQQQDFVGVQLADVLPRQVVRLDQSQLQQPHQEGSGTREAVEHMHPLIGEGLAEVLPQHLIG